MKQFKETRVQKSIRTLSEIAPKWFTILGWIIILSIFLALAKSLDSFLYKIILFSVVIFSYILIAAQIITFGVHPLFDFVEKDAKSKLRWFFALILFLFLCGSVYFASDLSILISKFTFPSE